MHLAEALLPLNYEGRKSLQCTFLPGYILNHGTPIKTLLSKVQRDAYRERCYITYRKIVKRVNPTSSHHKDICLFFPLPLFLLSIFSASI